jgi:hypothetical protein
VNHLLLSFLFISYNLCVNLINFSFGTFMQPGSTADDVYDDRILLDGNETIFSELDNLPSQSVEKLSPL